MKYQTFIFLVVIFIVNCVGAKVQSFNDKSMLDISDNEVISKPISWLKTAQDVVASPAGHVVVQVAKELLNRSAGNSQVNTLFLKYFAT